MRPEWINLSQPVMETEHMGTHGSPKIDVESINGHDRSISVTSLTMSAHSGTHMDAASHITPGGRSMDTYSISELVGPGVVLDVQCEDGVAVTAERLLEGGASISEGDVVFVHTGFAKHFGTRRYFNEHPYLSVDAAELLIGLKVRMVGMDTPTPDMPLLKRDAPFDLPIHVRLVEANVLIVENLGGELSELVGQRLLLGILPLAVHGGDGGPGVAFGLRLEADNHRTSTAGRSA